MKGVFAMDNQLLYGAVDIHCHVGPSVAKRIEDAAEMLMHAKEAGYKAFVVKDHYFPTVMGAQMIEKHLGEGKTNVYGSICLNNSVGGINIHAVDAACSMGAKIVFMPTVSALNHINHHKNASFVGAGNMKVDEKPIYYLDQNGELKPEVVEVLAYLAEHHPETVLGTGHGSVPEINKLIDRAVSFGLKKVLVNHPFFHIGASIEDIVHWAEQGAYIEVNAVVFDEVFPAAQHIPISIAKEVIEKVGPDHVVLDSDLGQAKNPEPVLGMSMFLKALIDMCGIKESDIDTMLKVNPSKLLGI
jgi:hypothetical protein